MPTVAGTDARAGPQGPVYGKVGQPSGLEIDDRVASQRFPSNGANHLRPDARFRPLRRAVDWVCCTDR